MRLLVIEDAGQALPATYRHHQVGGLGDVTCFTFFAQKALSLGEGGFICTNSASIADRCRVLVMSPWDLLPPALEDEPDLSTSDTVSIVASTKTAPIRLAKMTWPWPPRWRHCM